jgi:hypothetical protein
MRQWLCLEVGVWWVWLVIVVEVEMQGVSWNIIASEREGNNDTLPSTHSIGA